MSKEEKAAHDAGEREREKAEQAGKLNEMAEVGRHAH